ncbi:MAG: FAD binding domain-containing protein [Saprospirales bacterium]|nr:FAD binding domain-containing protein [Saprospirales bacterium]
MAHSNLGFFKYLAGGTDVMVNRFQDNEKSPCLIDITRLPGLRGVKKVDGFLRIGALEPLESLKQYEEIRTEFPMLIEAALSVGAPLLRKTATLGGNVLCENRCLYYNQSEWWRESVGYCLKCDGDICIATQGKNACFSELVSDTAPALIAMDAEIEVIDLDGARRVKLEDIYTGDGVKPRNLPETSIVTAILLPLDRGFRTSYFKLRQRESLEFTSLTAAIALDKTGETQDCPVRCRPQTGSGGRQKGDDPEALIKKAIKGARAIDNDMYTRKYRREMIGVYLRRGLEKL